MVEQIQLAEIVRVVARQGGEIRIELIVGFRGEDGLPSALVKTRVISATVVESFLPEQLTPDHRAQS